MSRLLGVMRSIDDRVNPVVVKELRQAVQSRMVIAVLLLSLLVNVATTAAFLTWNLDLENTPRAGQDLFAALFVMLVLTCMVFVPLYVAVRMTMERNHSNIDLLFITTLPPQAIVRGKFLAGVAMTALIYSACMPFLSFTYLLRGIDLPSIFFSLGVSFLCNVLAIMMSILVGSITGGLLLRLLVAFFYLYAGGTLLVMALTVGTMASRSGLASMLFGISGWTTLLVSSLLGLTGLIFMYLLSVASVSPKTSNRMFPVRVFLTFCWVLYGAIWIAWSLYSGDSDYLIAWMWGSTVLSCLVLGLVLSERESWSPRLRRDIPRRLVPRILAWLFYTGAAGGMIWASLIAIITLIIGVSLYGNWIPSSSSSSSLSTNFTNAVYAMGKLWMFTWCYAMTGLWLRRMIAPRSPPLLGTVLAVVLAALVSTIPQFIAYSYFDWRVQISELPLIFVIANPFLVNEPRIDQTAVLVFLEAWFCVMLLLNYNWFRQQWKAFRRHVPAGAEAEAASGGGDAVPAVALESIVIVDVVQDRPGAVHGE